MAALILIAALWLAAADPVTVHGTLPPGAKLEFRAPGSADRIVAEASPFRLQMPPGRYDLALTYASGRRARGAAWLTLPDTELNVQPEATGRAATPEYDLLADWRVVNEKGEGVGGARVILEAEPGQGAPERLTLWVIVGEQEKESTAAETTPDGRFLFRVRESRLIPDRIAALRVTVEAKGFQTAHLRFTPVLEFSPSGHLFAKYPEEGLELKLKRSP
jgi:hypothetical protein